MNIDTIVSTAKPILTKYQIRKAALFGSVARGRATPTSDIDILVDPPEHFGLFDLAGLTVDLEEALDRKVDIIAYKAIRPAFRNSILKYEHPFL